MNLISSFCHYSSSDFKGGKFRTLGVKFLLKDSGTTIVYGPKGLNLRVLPATHSSVPRPFGIAVFYLLRMFLLSAFTFELWFSAPFRL